MPVRRGKYLRLAVDASLTWLIDITDIQNLKKQ